MAALWFASVPVIVTIVIFHTCSSRRHRNMASAVFALKFSAACQVMLWLCGTWEWLGTRSQVEDGINWLLCCGKLIWVQLYSFNTLLSGHAEMRDCSPVCCWRVTHFYVFLTRRPAHLFVILPGSLIASGLSTVDAECLGLKLQINRPIMTPYF
jgi:hypothetical protein